MERDLVSVETHVKLWKLSGESAKELEADKPLSEGEIQKLLENSPWIIGDNVALLKREFDTGYGFADLLFLTDKAGLIIVEVKHEAQRDAVSQLLGYGYWASKLRIRGLRRIIEDITGMPLSDFLRENLSVEEPEDIDDDAPVDYVLLLVAPSMDYKTKAAIDYLKAHNVPIDALTLHYFRDPETGEKYLARIYYSRRGEPHTPQRKEVVTPKKFLEIMEELGHGKLAQKILNIFSEFINKYKDKGVQLMQAPKTFGISLCNREIDIALQVLGADQGYHGVWVKSFENRRKVAEIARAIGLEKLGFEIREPNEEKSMQKIIAFGRRGSGKSLIDSIEDLGKFTEILPDLLEKLMNIC